MFPLDARQEAALSDPIYMLKLYKRVAHGLAPRTDASAKRALPASFLAADRRCVASADPPLEPHAVLNAAYSLLPTSVLPRQDVSLLLHVLPLEEHRVDSDGGDGGCTRLGDVLSSLRDLIPFRTWQIAQVVRDVRAVVEKSEVMSPFEEHVTDLLDYEASPRRQAKEAPPPLLRTQELVTFLDRVCGVSASLTHLLVAYLSDGEAEKGEEDAVPAVLRDVVSIHQLFFTPELPAVVEYPLLMARFAEASLDCSESESRPTGSLALRASLAAAELSYPTTAATPKASSSGTTAAALDLDFGTLNRATLSPRQFFYVCRAMQVGFEQRESDRLFDFLQRAHSSGDSVAVADLIAAFRQYFPPVPLSMLRLVQAAAIAWLRRGPAGSLAFVQLYASLQQWGVARIPMAAFVQAFRQAGVPDGVAGVMDIDLEWLRLKAPTRVDLLLMLCSPVAPSRSSVIAKLFERLDSNKEGVVQCAACMQSFTPERIEGASVRRLVAPWKAAFAAYMAEMEEATLDYDVFAYFWYMVSAGVEDDPTFSVAIWQGYGLSDDVRRPRRR